MSAFSVSRTGLPFSQLSATASISLFASIASATLFSTAARCVADASPQASFAACAASNANSTSCGVDSATSVIAAAVAGLRSTRYFPAVGSSHFPPMKFSYRGRTVTMLPGRPGGTYFMVHSLIHPGTGPRLGVATLQRCSRYTPQGRLPPTRRLHLKGGQRQRSPPTGSSAASEPGPPLGRDSAQEPSHRQPRALTSPERLGLLEVLHSERFADAAPATVSATVLDEGVHLGSESTMYRLLRGRGGPATAVARPLTRRRSNPNPSPAARTSSGAGTSPSSPAR